MISMEFIVGNIMFSWQAGLTAGFGILFMRRSRECRDVVVSGGVEVQEVEDKEVLPQGDGLFASSVLGVLYVLLPYFFLRLFLSPLTYVCVEIVNA